MDLEEARTKDTYNRFFARGRIIGIGIDDYGHKRFVLFIRGNGGQRASKNMEDKENVKPAPGSRPVYLSIAFGNNTPHNVRVNDIVEVEGRMVAYPYFNETVEKWGFIQYLKADSIIPAVPELTKVFGEEAKGFSTERHYSRVYVKGVVIDKYKKESSIWHKLTLCVEGDQDDRRSSHIRAQYSDRMRVNDIQYEIGDTMALIGTFSYSRKASKNDDSRIIYFENIIVDDMAVVRRKERVQERPFDGGFGDFGEEGNAETVNGENIEKKRE